MSVQHKEWAAKDDALRRHGVWLKTLSNFPDSSFFFNRDFVKLYVSFTVALKSGPKFYSVVALPLIISLKAVSLEIVIYGHFRSYQQTGKKFIHSFILSLIQHILIPLQPNITRELYMAQGMVLISLSEFTVLFILFLLPILHVCIPSFYYSFWHIVFYPILIH